MATYRNYDDLIGTELTNGDFVKFPYFNLTYQVTPEYLNLLGGGNYKIFELLHMSGKEKCSLASECYGYVSDHGYWPEYKFRDYSAATRLVLRLYQIIDKLIQEEKIKDLY